MYAADRLRGVDGDSGLDITDAQKHLDLAERILIAKESELARQLGISLSDDTNDEEQAPA